MRKIVSRICVLAFVPLLFAACSGGGHTSSSVPGTQGQSGAARHTKARGDATIYTLPNANSSPEGMTAGPDGNIWFAENFNTGVDRAGIIARITSAGALTEFQIPDQGSQHVHPTFVTTGSDGKIWFAAYDQSNGVYVGSVTTSGSAFSVYPFTVGASIRGLTGGPDGNLWVTSAGCRCPAVSKVSTSGVVLGTVFVPKDPGVIITGPDNNLWVVEPNDHAIVRVTPSLTATSFNTGLAGLTGDVVTDGVALYYTASNGGQYYLGKMSRTGAAMGYLGVPSASPNNLMPLVYRGGTDNDFWLLNSGISQVTFPQILVTYPLPDPNPQTLFAPGIALSPSGDTVWYADRTINAVVQFDTR